MKVPKILSSSVNPAQFSLTLTSLVPLIIAIGAMFGIDIPQTSIDEVMSAVVAIVSALGVLYGAYRKVATWWKNRV